MRSRLVLFDVDGTLVDTAGAGRRAIEQAFADYQRTQFGGWPWPSADPNHGPDKGRFALHADGTVDEPTADVGS